MTKTPQGSVSLAAKGNRSSRCLSPPFGHTPRTPTENLYPRPQEPNHAPPPCAQRARLRRSSTSIPGGWTSVSRRLGVTTFASRGLSGCYKPQAQIGCGLLLRLPQERPSLRQRTLAQALLQCTFSLLGEKERQARFLGPSGPYHSAQSEKPVNESSGEEMGQSSLAALNSWGREIVREIVG